MDASQVGLHIHPPNLKMFTWRPLLGSVMYSVQVVSATKLLSQDYILVTAPAMGNAGRMDMQRTEDGVRSPSLARSTSQVNRQSHPLVSDVGFHTVGDCQHLMKL